MHANQVTSSEGLLFYVQPAFDATLSTFLSNLQRALDATRSTFLSNLQRALDATRSTFLSKHLFPVVFHDACIMESKHKNIQNFVSSFTDTVGDWHLRNFWKKSAKQWRHANASETRGKTASATPREEMTCNKKVALQFYKRLFFRQQLEKWCFAMAKTTFMLTWCSRNRTAVPGTSPLHPGCVDLEWGYSNRFWLCACKKWCRDVKKDRKPRKSNNP